MKFGANGYIFTDCWSDSSLDILDKAKQLGLDCFEISVGEDVRFTPRLTRRRAEALGLELTIGPGGNWPTECDLSADDPTDRKRGLTWHERQVDLAEELGAVAYCGALYGHPGTVKRRIPPANEYKHIAESLHQLAEYGERHGVAIVLEPMSHFRTHVANTPEQVMRLITMADHRNLCILLDTYHLVTEVRDYARAIWTARDRLWGIHACENDRGVPGGGLVPWDVVFAALKEITFDGYIFLETYNSSIGDFAYQRGMFHNVCPNGHTFVQEGIIFLKRVWLMSKYSAGRPMLR
jgi:D-psicose/D-tagatose/L-ribulose 3-epimerase